MLTLALPRDSPAVAEGLLMITLCFRSRYSSEGAGVVGPGGGQDYETGTSAALPTVARSTSIGPLPFSLPLLLRHEAGRAARDRPGAERRPEDGERGTTGWRA